MVAAREMAAQHRAGFGKQLFAICGLRQQRAGPWLEDFRGWIDNNIAALEGASENMDAKNLKCLKEFSDLRSKGVLTRVTGIRKLGLYRQTRIGTLAMLFATACGRL